MQKRTSLRIAALIGALVWTAVAAPAQSGRRGVSAVADGPVTKLPGPLQRYAVVVGVDEYQDPSVSRLSGAANDARTLASALQSHAAFPPDHVSVLASGARQGALPTRANIVESLSVLAGRIPNTGLLVVAFSGHGIDQAGSAYLLPSDARPFGNRSLLEDTALSVAKLRELVKATGAGQVVLILDACRNDPKAGRSIAPNPLTPAYPRTFDFDVANREVRAFVTLYATALGQRAYEYPAKGMGFFTWALVEGLQGKAANEEGEVTLAGLLRYVEDTVPKQVTAVYGREREQRPWHVVKGYLAENLVLSAVAVQAPTAAQPPAADADLAFWESIKDSKDPGEYRAYLEAFPKGKFAPLARHRASLGSGQGSGGSSSGSAETPVRKPKPLATKSSGGVTLEFTGCVRRGGVIYVFFDLTNTGRDQSVNIGTYAGSLAVDEAGNASELENYWIGNSENSSFTLVTGIRTRCAVRLRSTLPDGASRLSLLRIPFSTDASGYNVVEFRDLPIKTE